MNAILTIEQYANEQRMQRIRRHYAQALRQQEHNELIERGEAIRREWNALPIPRHRALTLVPKEQA